MTDVVEIAKERREKVAAEVAKLDAFIRIAEALLKYNLSKSNKASETEDEKATESTQILNRSFGPHKDGKPRIGVA